MASGLATIALGLAKNNIKMQELAKNDLKDRLSEASKLQAIKSLVASKELTGVDYNLLETQEAFAFSLQTAVLVKQKSDFLAHCIKTDIEDPEKLLEAPKSLQAPMTEREFIAHHYNSTTPRSSFFARRFSSVSNFFGLRTFIPVRGDGNCFINATAAGLLHTINKDPNFRQKLISTIEAYNASPKIYV